MDILRQLFYNTLLSSSRLVETARNLLSLALLRDGSLSRGT